MHILTYLVGHKLAPFMSMEHLIAGLQAAIEGSVFSTWCSYNVHIVAGHRLAYDSRILHRNTSSGNVSLANGFLGDL
jgi:hypothetical protein